MAAQSKLDSKLRFLEFKFPQNLNQDVSEPQILPFTHSHFVIAKHRNTQKWLKARVLSKRLSKCKASQKISLKFSLSYRFIDLAYLANTPKTDDAYEYYVHYENTNRRNDCWLTLSEIQPTEEQIPEESEVVDYGQHANDDPQFGLSAAQLALHRKITKIKTIQRVRIGNYILDAWYYSPYPRPYQNLQMLYVCQYCLNFYAKKSQLIRHCNICPLYHPPGDQIYRNMDLQISIFEVDGAEEETYCQNLGYLSKLFLDHKNLMYDMSIFRFYVLCEIRDNSFHIVGYFSKSKESLNNLSCILIFPFHQRKGLGKLLIDFSYKLSFMDGKVGSPQKPLSDLGRRAYLNYWTQKILQLLIQDPKKYADLNEISIKTGIHLQDIYWTLDSHDLVIQTAEEVFLCAVPQVLQQIYKKCGKPVPEINPKDIHYVPWRNSCSLENPETTRESCSEYSDPAQL